MQFLWKRQKKDPPEYTHIVAMGCSKRHCAECNTLFQLVLGKGYDTITAAAVGHNQVVVGAAAADADRKYPKYYISEELEKIIQILTGTKLTYEGQRYLSPSRSDREARTPTAPDVDRLQSLRDNPRREKLKEYINKHNREREASSSAHNEPKKRKTTGPSLEQE